MSLISPTQHDNFGITKPGHQETFNSIMKQHLKTSTSDCSSTLKYEYAIATITSLHSLCVALLVENSSKKENPAYNFGVRTLNNENLK